LTIFWLAYTLQCKVLYTHPTGPVVPSWEQVVGFQRSAV
jgi:hypothetical protein